MPDNYIWMTDGEGRPVRQARVPVLTRIQNVSIPDAERFWIYPQFILSAREAGNQMTTYGDLLNWLNKPEVRKSIENSQYHDNLRMLLTDPYQEGIFSTCFEGEFVLSDEVSEETALFQTIIGGHSSRNTFHLLSNEGQEDVIEYYLSHLSYPYHWVIIPLDNSPLRTFPEMDNVPEEFKRVMNYTWCPSAFKFLRTERDSPNTQVYFGMEIEVSTILSPLELQTIVCAYGKPQVPFFYMKSDSSISGSKINKYEIVTYPCTPRFLKQEFTTLFDKLGELATEKGLSLGDVFCMAPSNSNGIHIHVNKDAFVYYRSHRSSHLNRFMTFWNGWDKSFQSWLQQVSRRPTELRNSQYCKVHPFLDGRTVARRIKSGATEDYRYAACHETPRTVEVRVFQGLMDLKHILSCIELVQAALEWSVNTPYTAYTSRVHEVFSEWVLKQPGYRNAKEAINQCA